VDLLPFDEYVRSLNRKRMSAGVLFRDSAGRVLLVEPSYKPHWDIPGGAVEADEPPWRTVTREVREELGIDHPLGALLVVDYMPADERMPEGVAFIFDGGLVTDAEVAALADRTGREGEADTCSSTRCRTPGRRQRNAGFVRGR
jgi:8-oxo-dGTP pyrophosphatase MutT (NUDIX family)